MVITIFSGVSNYVFWDGQTLISMNSDPFHYHFYCFFYDFLDFCILNFSRGGGRPVELSGLLLNQNLLKIRIARKKLRRFHYSNPKNNLSEAPWWKQSYEKSDVFWHAILVSPRLILDLQGKTWLRALRVRCPARASHRQARARHTNEHSQS